MLYHAEVCWPRRIRSQLPKGEKQLQYTQHALRASLNDRYGEICLPIAVNLESENVYIFEAEEIRKGKIEKVVFRMPLDSRRDICMAATPKRGALIVRTVWINLNSDPHKTLDRTKYFNGNLQGKTR